MAGFRSECLLPWHPVRRPTRPRAHARTTILFRGCSAGLYAVIPTMGVTDAQDYRPPWSVAGHGQGLK
jgi:hypothetical protein